MTCASCGRELTVSTGWTRHPDNTRTCTDCPGPVASALALGLAALAEAREEAA